MAERVLPKEFVIAKRICARIFSTAEKYFLNTAINPQFRQRVRFQLNSNFNNNLEFFLIFFPIKRCFL
jgi:hypothetical protein